VVSGAAAVRRPGALTALLREAHAAGRLLDLVPVLTAAAGVRAALDRPAPAGPPPATLVSEGEPAPQLVCVPSFLAGSGAHQFVRLAAALPRRRRASALTLPGYGPGDPPPASWEAAVEALAAAARRSTGDRPYVLVGYSVGGVLAHAAADVLERSGPAPAGVVLLDTFDPAEDQLPIFGWAMGELLDRDAGGVAVDDDGLLAMGGYLRLLGTWKPAAPVTPTLLVRAGAAGPAARWPRWPGAGTEVTVPGAGHFSLVEEHAAAAAVEVDGWLAGPVAAAEEER
jgi:thioesterase domain-containing protein